MFQVFKNVLNFTKFILDVLKGFFLSWKFKNLVQETYCFSWSMFENYLHVEGACLLSLFYAKTIVA